MISPSSTLLKRYNDSLSYDSGRVGAGKHQKEQGGLPGTGLKHTDVSNQLRKIYSDGELLTFSFNSYFSADFFWFADGLCLNICK